VNLAEILAANLVVMLGSVVQAASGVGAGFLMAPLIAWIDLGFLPGPMIFGSLALSGIMAWRERGAIDRANLPVIFAGILAGSLPGGWILSSVSGDALGIVFGAVILAAVALTASGLSIPLNRRNALTSGFISGVMGTSTGIGAPILAILYQRQAPALVRATLAYLYTGASLMILVVLAAYGEFGVAEIGRGLSLVPGFLVGYALANSLRHRLARFGARGPVLAVSAVAALALLARGLAPLLTN
jgi:uncharacterized membrane protein YfcA